VKLLPQLHRWAKRLGNFNLKITTNRNPRENAPALQATSVLPDRQRHAEESCPGDEHHQPQNVVMAVLLADACSAGERTPYKRKQNEVKLQTSRNANYVPSIAYGAS